MSKESLVGVGRPSSAVLGGAHGHAFKKTYFGRFTWCALCGDFIWGVHEPQGYQCKVCSMCVHKKCAKEADTMTSCTEMMAKNTKKVQTLKQDKLLDRLAALEAQIENDLFLEPVRVEAYLTLVVNIDDSLLADYKFDCFKTKLLQDGPHSPSPGTLQYVLSEDQRWDTLACLLGWIIKCPNEKSQICAAQLLLALLHEDTNKEKFLARRHAHELCKLLQLDLERPPKSYRLLSLVVACLAQASTYAGAPSEPVRDVQKRDHALKLLFLEHVPGDVANKALGLVITFLHKLAKVKIHQSAYRETYKEERAYVAQALMDGARLLAAFYTHPDKSFMAYVDSKKGLALVLAGANAGLVTLHREIAPNQLKFGQLLYDSILCQVYEGEYQDYPVAIKTFNAKGLGFKWEEFRKEISLLSSVQHPNVCRLHGACTDSSSDRPFLVMDLFTRGSIKDVTQPDAFQEHEMRRMARARAAGRLYTPRAPVAVDTSLVVNLAMQAANGIAHLHSKFIVHRDIKPGNFLVDEAYRVFVIDFGVSRVAAPDPRDKMTITGTPTYMAPEVMDNKPYDEKADTYSFALLIWSMLTGKEPYEDIHSLNLADEVVNKGVRPPIPIHTHPGLAHLMERGWDANPHVRPSFDEILAILYSIQDPVTRRCYCRIWENVPDPIFATYILPRLDRRSLLAFGVTNKRFNALCTAHRSVVEPRDASTGFTPPMLITNRKQYSATVSGKAPPLMMGERTRMNTIATTSAPSLSVPSSGNDSIVSPSERRSSWLAKSPRRDRLVTGDALKVSDSDKSGQKSPRLTPRSLSDEADSGERVVPVINPPD